MPVPLPNFTLATPSSATSSASVNVPFAIGGSATTGLPLMSLLLFGLGGLIVYKLLK